LFISASLSFLSFKCSKLSHFNFTKPHKGSQFSEYRVHFLSVNNFLALGGNHNQNSSTFTPNFLAAEKCHSSCISTTKENISIATKIHKKIIILF
jgi:hypothetical protein